MAADNRAGYGRIGFTVFIGVLAILGALIYLGGLRGRGAELLVETYYDKAVSGLSVGSPVNFRGVKIGEVREIALVGSKYLSPKSDDYDPRIYILMAININAAGLGEDGEDVEAETKELIDRGLRATVTSSGVTGISRIEINFHKDVGPVEAPTWRPRHIYLPPKVSLLESFSESATKVMNQINRMDISAVWSNIQATTEAMARTTESMRGAVEARHADIERLLENANETVDAAKDTAQQVRRNPSLLIRNRVRRPLPETAE